MSDRRTTAGAYAKIEAHEDLCAERYRAINETLGELKSDGKAQSALLCGASCSAWRPSHW
jgi:hypothetical protein